MTEIAAGPMTQRITLQARLAAQDAMGQESRSWLDVGTVWAAAEPIRGREFFASGQMQSEVTVRFRIRYRADVAPTMRVVWRGQPH